MNGDPIEWSETVFIPSGSFPEGRMFSRVRFVAPLDCGARRVSWWARVVCWFRHSWEDVPVVVEQGPPATVKRCRRCSSVRYRWSAR